MSTLEMIIKTLSDITAVAGLEKAVEFLDISKG